MNNFEIQYYATILNKQPNIFYQKLFYLVTLLKGNQSISINGKPLKTMGEKESISEDVGSISVININIKQLRIRKSIVNGKTTTMEPISTIDIPTSTPKRSYELKTFKIQHEYSNGEKYPYCHSVEFMLKTSSGCYEYIIRHYIPEYSFEHDDLIKIRVLDLNQVVDMDQYLNMKELYTKTKNDLPNSGFNSFKISKAPKSSSFSPSTSSPSSPSLNQSSDSIKQSMIGFTQLQIIQSSSPNLSPNQSYSSLPVLSQPQSATTATTVPTKSHWEYTKPNTTNLRSILIKTKSHSSSPSLLKKPLIQASSNRSDSASSPASPLISSPTPGSPLLGNIFNNFNIGSSSPQQNSSTIISQSQQINIDNNYTATNTTTTTNTINYNIPQPNSTHSQYFYNVPTQPTNETVNINNNNNNMYTFGYTSQPQLASGPFLCLSNDIQQNDYNNINNSNQTYSTVNNNYDTPSNIMDQQLVDSYSFVSNDSTLTYPITTQVPLILTYPENIQLPVNPTITNGIPLPQSSDYPGLQNENDPIECIRNLFNPTMLNAQQFNNITNNPSLQYISTPVQFYDNSPQIDQSNQNITSQIINFAQTQSNGEYSINNNNNNSYNNTSEKSPSTTYCFTNYSSAIFSNTTTPKTSQKISRGESLNQIANEVASNSKKSKK